MTDGFQVSRVPFRRGRENAWSARAAHVPPPRFTTPAPLRNTLLRLIDFDILNNGDVRYADTAR